MVSSSKVTDLGEFYTAKGRTDERKAIASWLRDVAAGSRAEKVGDKKPVPGAVEDDFIENAAQTLEQMAAMLEADQR